ncbi:MAG: hypothetical protein NT002_10460 [candidate division Zixibacteria bacterium]|nr:hypothetical protein [candidate division Zixibacteria bacterium]
MRRLAITVIALGILFVFSGNDLSTASDAEAVLPVAPPQVNVSAGKNSGILSDTVFTAIDLANVTISPFVTDRLSAGLMPGIEPSPWIVGRDMLYNRYFVRIMTLNGLSRSPGSFFAIISCTLSRSLISPTGRR